MLKSCNLVIRFRMVSVLFFWVLPAFFCVFASNLDGKEFFVKNSNFLVYDGGVGVLKKDKNVMQFFKVPENISAIEEIRVSFTNEGKISDGILEISLKDVTNNRVLFKKEYETFNFKNIVPTKFDIGKLEVSPQSLYCLNFVIKKEDSKNVISINKTKVFGDENYEGLKKNGIVFGGEFAVLEKEKKKYNLCLDVLGR